MKFTQHLTSHLTPEWKKYYVHYEELKEMIYEMVRLQSLDDQKTSVERAGVEPYNGETIRGKWMKRLSIHTYILAH